MAGPVFVGAVQLTSRLVLDPAVAVTEGAAGRRRGLVHVRTVIVTVTVSVPPLLSSALTMTV